MDIVKVTESTERITISLTGSDIIKILQEIGELKGADKVNVSIKVPQGGDYSGMTLDIDEECPININYKIVTTK